MTAKLLIIAVVLPVLALSATPIATVSTSGPLLLNGAAVPSAGADSWPVSVGDQIETSSAPAILAFSDGTQLTLAKNSRARVGTAGVDLLAGTALYKKAAASKINMQALGRPVDLQSRAERVVSILGTGKVAVRDKNSADNDTFRMMKHKHPKPKSPHDKDDDDRDDDK